MAVYAIGDVHGQYDGLMRLLEQVKYDENKDKLWFVGDIINRGPDSLNALRFVVQLGKRAHVVVGNHDFTLMVQANGLDNGRIKNTTKEIITAKDGLDLIEAMYQWPLMVEDEERHLIMAHAGFYPLWTRQQAREQNTYYCEKMRENSVSRKDFLQQVYRNGNGNWEKAKNETERACFSVNAFARMRYLTTNNALDYAGKMPPAKAPKNLIPWYQIFEMKQKTRVVFGHWAALGINVHKSWACIDGGAAWGGKLVAFDVDKWTIAGTVKI